MHRPAWKPGGGSEAQWCSTFERYAYPRIGRKPVHAIDAADLMAVLQPLWIEKHETARRLRLRIGQVMKWAIGQGHRTDNPAGDAVGAALPKVDARPVHQRALPHAEVGAALATVRRTGAAPAAKLAFEFMVLCAVRSGEARGAAWDEVDLDRAVWTLPAARMKAGREHRVPLSPRALGVLREAGRARLRRARVPRPVDRARADRHPRSATCSARPASTPFRDGFRSSFRDWAAECTDAPHEVCELALAHVNGNRVEAAYRRTDLFDRRRVLMSDWGRVRRLTDCAATGFAPPQPGQGPSGCRAASTTACLSMEIITNRWHFRSSPVVSPHRQRRESDGTQGTRKGSPRRAQPHRSHGHVPERRRGTGMDRVRDLAERSMLRASAAVRAPARPATRRCRTGVRTAGGYFSVKTGTPLASSNIPLRKWAIAIYLCLTSLKSVSSMKLAPRPQDQPEVRLVHAPSHPRSVDAEGGRRGFRSRGRSRPMRRTWAASART